MTHRLEININSRGSDYSDVLPYHQEVNNEVHDSFRSDDNHLPYHIDGPGEGQRKGFVTDLRNRVNYSTYLDDEESGLIDRMLQIDGKLKRDY